VGRGAEGHIHYRTERGRDCVKTLVGGGTPWPPHLQAPQLSEEIATSTRGGHGVPPLQNSFHTVSVAPDAKVNFDESVGKYQSSPKTVRGNLLRPVSLASGASALGSVNPG
jgi:hypothetical protein